MSQTRRLSLFILAAPTLESDNQAETRQLIQPKYEQRLEPSDVVSTVALMVVVVRLV
jgi:hypothetical protein